MRPFNQTSMPLASWITKAVAVALCAISYVSSAYNPHASAVVLDANPTSPPVCPKTAPAVFPVSVSSPLVVSISPASFYEGSILTLKVNGARLDPTWTILLCPSTVNPTNTVKPVVGALDSSSSANLLTATLNAAPGTAGAYAIYFADSKGTLYDSGQKLIINSSDDTKYHPCVGPDGSVPININIQCSFSPLSYETTLDLFGKGVAKKFIAVYVVVQNKNQNLEYLLQDVRGGFSDYLVSSYDKQIPQGVATKEEQFSARAIIFRLTAASASVLTGIAGVVGNTLLQDAVTIFSGPAQAGLQTAIPDLSSAELNKINNLGFSVTSTEIPKGGAISIVAFVPAEIVPPPPSRGTTKQKSNYFQKYQGAELREFFKGMKLAVAGMHVQEMTPSSQPAIKLLVNPPSSLKDFTLGLMVTIEGSGLDSVKGVELISGDGKTVIIGKLQALPNAPSASIDPYVDNLVIPATTTTAAGPGTYEIKFILADGSVVDSSQSISIPTPTLTSATFTTSADGTLTVTLAGTALNATGAIAGFDFGPQPINSAANTVKADGTSATLVFTPPAGTDMTKPHTVQLLIGSTKYTQLPLTAPAAPAAAPTSTVPAAPAATVTPQ